MIVDDDREHTIKPRTHCEQIKSVQYLLNEGVYATNYRKDLHIITVVQIIQYDNDNNVFPLPALYVSFFWFVKLC